MFCVHTRKKKTEESTQEPRHKNFFTFLREVNVTRIYFPEAHFNSSIAWDKNWQLENHFLIAFFVREGERSRLYH